MLNLLDTQEQLRSSARRYLGSAVSTIWSSEGWAEVAELGWIGAAITQEQGGYGGAVELVIVAQEIGRALARIPFLTCGVFPTVFMTAAGLGDLNQATLDQVMAGSVVIAGVPNSGRRAGASEEAALILHPHGTISGALSHVGGIEGADLILAIADRSPDGQDGDAGRVVIALEGRQVRELADAFDTIDGGMIRFCSFSAANIRPVAVFDSPASIAAFDRATDMVLLGQCGELVGAMQVMFELTRDYLKTRRQFGKELSQFQALRHRLADMYAELNQAEAILRAGISAMEGQDGADRARIISACKLRVARAANYVGAQAVQLHGAIALTEEYAVGAYFRRSLVLRKTWGDESFHAAQLATSRIA